MRFVKLLGILLLAAVAGCGGGPEKDDSKPRLLVYCGITMVHPMLEIAQAFEKLHNCQVSLIQGGSEDLYQGLRLSRQGDLYLPGSPSYRHKYLEEGLLADYVYLGDNQAALIVQEGNPKKISADIKNLADPQYAVVIGNPESGSIGLETQRILEKAGVYEQVLDNAVSLAAASRNISKNLLEDGIDLAMNWRATANFSENRDIIDALVLPEEVAPKKALLLNLLTFSNNPELARTFMRYAAAPSGQDVFRKYGFLDQVTVQGKIKQ